ncbi:MAG: flippase-like domain-containing protein [Thermoleophilia bacterium]|nr:flippase-like domain-containing protein [Thermoleophilia bacterium]MBJ7333300.1 flippase-like domain-containing protein [Thermoleophilia bacterium]
MTKHQTILRAVVIGLVVIVATVIADGVLSRMDLSWLAWVLDIGVILLLTIGVWGMFGASSPLFGGVVDGSRIRRQVVALTFDDGPSPDTTPKILDTLKADGARATFFVLGKHAELYPELVERIVREGHELGNHGYDHGILAFAGPAQVHRQLHRTERLLKQSGAPPVRVFRAPHGFRSPFVSRTAGRLGYATCAWSAGVFDTAKPGVDVIVKRSVKALKPGAILLLHDADGWGNDDRSQTAEALPAILEAARAESYEFVTMSEIAALDPPKPISWRRLAIVATVVVVLAAIGLARVDRGEVTAIFDTLRSLSIPLLILSLIANFISVAFKAVIWKASLDSVPGVKAPYRAVVPAIFVGFLLNTVLIARLGEVGRMVVLRKRLAKDGQDVPLSTMTATVVMEQLVLGVTLAVLLVVMVFSVDGVPDWAGRGTLILLGVVLAGVVGVAVVEGISRWRLRRGDIAEDYARTWWRSTLRTVEFHLHAVSRGAQLLRRPRLAVVSFGAGILSWIAQIVGIYLALAAFNIDSNRVAAACVVFLVSNLVGFIPLVPGNLGVFQLAVATALSQAFGITFGAAVTFAIGLQVIEVALGAGLGFVFLSLAGLSFSDVRRTISRAEEEEAESRIGPPPVVSTVRGGALRT